MRPTEHFGFRRAFAQAAALAILPFLWAVDTAYSWLNGWRTISQVEFCVSIVMGMWLAVVLAFVLFRPGRRLLNRYWTQAALLCGSVTISLLLIELILRFVFPGLALDPQKRNTWPVGLHQVLRPDLTVIPGASEKARVTVNSDGIRGPEMPVDRHTKRVLCVGGSSTECRYLDDSKTWPNRLMELLNEGRPEDPCWVGNSGVSGRASREHLQFLQETDWLQKIDAIVIMVGINDLIRDLAGVPDGNLSSAGAPLWTKARLLAPVRRLWIRERARWSVLQDDRGEWYRKARQERQASRIVEESPLRDEDLAQYEQRLRSIAQLGKARGVQVVFVSQPTVWRKNLPPEIEARLWFGRIPSKGFLSSGSLRQAMDRYNNVTRHVCDVEGIDFADLSPMDGKAEFFYDDCHFTEAGAEEVARLIAQQKPMIGQR